MWKTWLPRLAAFCASLLLAASVVFWAMRWPVGTSGNALPIAAAPEALPAVDANVVARLLGVAAAVSVPAPDSVSRFRVTGIVAEGAGKGVALVSIDSKPAKAFRVGSELETGWVLQSVAARSIALGAELGGPVLLTLELPRQP